MKVQLRKNCVLSYDEGSAPVDKAKMSLHEFVLAARNNTTELQAGLMVRGLHPAV